MGLTQPQKPIRDVLELRDGDAHIDITNDAYKTFVCFSFRGTDIISPVDVMILMWADEGKGIGCKLIDITNDTTIAEVADQTGNTTVTLVDLGTLSNLSAGAAIWEFQFKKSSGVGGTAYTAGIVVDY